MCRCQIASCTNDSRRQVRTCLFFVRRKPKDQLQLANRIVIFRRRLYELPRHVDFEVLSVTPIIDSPLKQQHVTVLRGTTDRQNGFVKGKHLRDARAHGKVRKGPAAALNELLECVNRS